MNSNNPRSMQSLNLNNPPQMIPMNMNFSPLNFSPNTTGTIQVTQISGTPTYQSMLTQSKKNQTEMNCMSTSIEPTAFPFSLDDPQEAETYRLWKKLCTITELREFEENQIGREKEKPESTHTVDQYINYLMSVSQENVPAKVVVKSTETGRPIFQHQKQKFTKKRKEWIGQNQELVDQLDYFANSKKEAEKRELELKEEREKREQEQRLAEIIREDERKRVNAKINIINGEEVITDSAPCFEGIHSTNLNLFRFQMRLSFHFFSLSFFFLLIY